MSWIDDYNNMPVVGTVQPFQPPQRKVSKKKKKDFLTDQISTVGGILGGIGGSFLAPIAGTVGGASAGSALGEAIENALMGEDLGKNVGQEALMGGLFAAPPLRALRAVGSGALKVAGKTAAGKNVGRKLEESGGRLLGTQANLTRAESRKIGVNPADVMSNINRRTGINSIDQMANVGSNVTGKNGVFSELTRNAIGNTPGVDISDLRDLTNNLLIDKAPMLSAGMRKNVLDQVKNSTVKAYGGSKGSLGTLANPYDAFDVARNFEKEASRLRSLPTPAAADTQLASVYSDLASEVKGRLFAAPGVQEGLNAARPAAKKALEELAKSTKNKREAQAYRALAKELDSISDIKQLRSAQKDFVDLGNTQQATARAEVGAAQRLGDNMQGLGRAVQRPTNLLAIPLDAATPWTGGTIANAGRNLQGIPSAAMQVAGRPAARGITKRVGAFGVGRGLLGQSAQEQDATLEDALMQAGQGTVDTGQFSTQPEQQQDPYPRENLIYDMQRDPENADKYFEYYQMMQEAFAPPEAGQLTASQETRAAAAQNALGDIPMLEDAISSGKLGGLKAVPGSSTQIGRALLGTENLDAALFNIADNILRARSGAAAPEAEVRRFAETFLPGPLDSEEAKTLKLQRAVRELQGYVNPQRVASGNIEEALMNAQGAY